MVSVQEAIQTIQQMTPRRQSIEIELISALHFTLSESVYSLINMPPFNQSAMDGYAVCIHSSDQYKLVGEVKAGDRSSVSLNSGEAIRIFTGAMVPQGADAVVKQEEVVKNDGSVTITKEIVIGENIRPQGEQIKANDEAMTKGSIINPGAIGFLSTLGVSHVSVISKPKIAVIATGSELVRPGEPRTGGQIYESNTFMLQAALNKANFSAEISSVEDDYYATKRAIKDSLDQNDVLIITGGISVGDYDFVGKALEDLGVTTGFYKLKQKPGKPFYFGKLGSKYIFALPGNPAAVLSCFYCFVLPSLRLQIGLLDVFARQERILLNAYNKTSKMTHFLKARSKNGEVEILSSQSSAMLSSFVDANCLIVMEQERESWEVGDKVDVIII